jgi:hypothetical protein
VRHRRSHPLIQELGWLRFAARKDADRTVFGDVRAVNRQTGAAARTAREIELRVYATLPLGISRLFTHPIYSFCPPKKEIYLL